MRYGALPTDLGLVEICPVEMMFWMYCPIKVPGMALMAVPDKLMQFMPIIHTIGQYDYEAFDDCYVYLTAKTLWVSGEYIGNRPGWHSDGFGTTDVNYIWSDRAPTEFIRDDFELPNGCDDAMAIMEARAIKAERKTYPDRHLMRLDPRVIHRSPVGFDAGMRTFVKVSVSRDRYDLEGNSVNHMLSDRWPLRPRSAERNHPQSINPPATPTP